MSEITRLQTAYKRADEARAQEISMFNPLPPFEEITHPWPLFWKAYRKGDFWTQMKGMASWKSRPQTNIPFQVVETNTTLLTDSRPTAVPYADSGHMDDYYLAEWLRAAYLKWWNDSYGDLKTTMGVKYSRIFGLGWWRLDEEKEGQVWETVHPDSIRVSPDTTIDSYMVREPTYLIYEYETQFGKLKNAFPKKGGELKKVEWDDFHPDWDVTGDYERLRPLDSSERLQPTKVVKVYQMWEQDPSEVEWKDPIGDQEVSKKKKKYPGGKVTTFAGGIAIDVRPNPYKHKMYPFVPVWAYIAPGQFYPMGDIQNIWPLVIMRNRMNQLLFDGTVKAGGGKIYLGKGSGLKNTDVSNAPYEVIEVPGDVGQVRHETPTAPSRHVFEYINLIDRDIDNTAGQHDISKGMRSQGNPVTAQEAMMLGESDRTRVRLAARLLTWSLNRLAKMWCYNVAQYEAETEMVFKVNADPDEEIPRLEDQSMVPVAFSPKDIMADGKIAEGLRYGIKFTEFSSLPNALNEDKQLAMGLFDRKVLDVEDLLLALDWPNARSIGAKAMKRLEQPPAPDGMPQGPPEGMPQGPPQGPPPDDGGLPPEIELAVMQLVEEGMDPEAAVQAVLEAAGGM
jgi:hypothetical protein